MANKANRHVFPKLFKRTSRGGIQEWEIWVEANNDGTAVITTRYGLQDGKKQTIHEVIKKGKNEGRKNATTAYQQAFNESDSEWTKQLERKGYGLTVDASAAIRSISPMLAYDIVKHGKDIDWSNAAAQPKLDGFRCLASISKGVVSLRSRENKPILTMDHIKESLKDVLEEGIILDGELWTSDLTFQEISSGIRRRSELSEKLEYHVYDQVVDTSFVNRYNSLRKFLVGLPSVNLVKTVKVGNRDDLTYFQSDCIEIGYEGAMLRHGTKGYEAGKRSKHLLKVKTWTDAEFKVVDAKEGRGTHAGMAIFVCQTPAGAFFDVLAPGSHTEKRAFWQNCGLYIGQMLTVKFFEWSTSEEKVPRFPVALRFRA